ncbi:MAG: 16S rRNA (cytosine(1402)-N(4))-methyltransferase RsmH [Gammaproteobacteria bacterium]|nr:16S rRNA (cytosine(1402)-N(4))-methyltransferase RsmH [Gammaproteobacteria bacterium]
MTQFHHHHSVLFDESLTALAIQPDGIYIDGTFGRGGHAKAVLEKLGGQGRLYALDKDPAAIAFAQEVVEKDKRFVIVQDSFAHLAERAQQWGVTGKVNGVLLDLGVSSPQLDDPSRGFSFRQDGPLDMRMNHRQGETAAEWVARVPEKEMIDVFKRYGEERYAKRIARAIVTQRQQSAITTTTQLADIVSRAHPAWEKGKHPATRVFQAIRIAVNRELEDLQDCLTNIIDVLAVGGRLVIISFHSLEDKIVKQFIQQAEKGSDVPSHIPVTASQLNIRLKRVGKMQQASAEELKQNPRARSARLRVSERIA